MSSTIKNAGAAAALVAEAVPAEDCKLAIITVEPAVKVVTIIVVSEFDKLVPDIIPC